MKKQLRFMGKSYDYDDTDSEVVIRVGEYVVRADWCILSSWDAMLVLRGSVLLTAGGRSLQSSLNALERKIGRIAALKEAK